MSHVITFPHQLRIVQPQAVEGADIAQAEAVSSFMADMLPKIERVTGPAETRLLLMSDDDLMATYQLLDGASPDVSRSSIEEYFLLEMVSAEVARRCALKGIATPWEQFLYDEEDRMAPANDQPGDGAA